jgi:hypothetical protein
LRSGSRGGRLPAAKRARQEKENQDVLFHRTREFSAHVC